MKNDLLSTLGARDFSSAARDLRPTAEDVSAFGQHRKFPPYARKALGTQGTSLHKRPGDVCTQATRVPRQLISEK